VRLPLRRTRAVSALALAAVLFSATATTGSTAQAVALRGSATSYSVSKNSDGSVVRWNPCSAIQYQVNLTYAPPGAWTDIQLALAKVSAATGMQFSYAGRTTVIPQATYGSGYNPLRTRPPLLIAWAAPGTGTGQTDLLTSTIAGRGGWRSISWSYNGVFHKPRIYTGFVVLNKKYNYLPGGFGSGHTRGELLMHELGHAVGLNHTADKTQIMYPTTTTYSATWGAGDTTGLRRVGRAYGCLL
jgi:hypothetical protein